MSSFSVVVVCAGKGSRFGEKKQFCSLGGIPIFFHSYLAFQNLKVFEIVYVIEKSDQSYYEKSIDKLKKNYPVNTSYHFVAGGKERYLSVWNGIQSCGSSDFVLIHDAARPLVCYRDLFNLKEWLIANPLDGVFLAQKVTDSIKKIDMEGNFVKNLNRNQLVRAETPQGFSLKKIKHAYEQYFDNDLGENKKREVKKIPTDDIEIFTTVGNSVAIIFSKNPNPKITYQQDLDLAKQFYIRYQINEERPKLLKD